MTGSPEAVDVTIGGRELSLTHLAKVLYPQASFTKADVIRYYARIAPLLLPHARLRPATRKRWVHGTGQSPFFQKNLGAGTPTWVARRTVQHQDHQATYPLVDEVATLVWLAQIAALEIHVPQWRFTDDGGPGGRAAKNEGAEAVPRGLGPGDAYAPASGLLHPDRLVFDLDPGDGAGLAECAHVAVLLRADLAGRGLALVPVTSGSKGIHLYARLDGSRTCDEATDLARDVAGAFDAGNPGLVVTGMRKATRTGKVLIDWSQNRAGKTTVTPYSLRGRAQPWVAAPRTWEEIEAPGLSQLTAHEVLERAAGGLDPAAALAGQEVGQPGGPRGPGKKGDPGEELDWLAALG